MKLLQYFPPRTNFRISFLYLYNNPNQIRMTKTIIFLIVAFSSLVSFGQHFEGKIVYKNSYTSKMPGVSDEQFTSSLGSVIEYYIKDGDYKSLMNGSLLEWQLYVNKDNKLYNKITNSESLLWYDGATNTDEVLKTEINKAVVDVLEYKCDELILTCKSGTQKYYFSPKLSIDTKKFEQHKFGNFYDFLSKTNAIPLKLIIETEQFIVESIATEIKPLKLDKTFFELPANAKTMKSPY